MSEEYEIQNTWKTSTKEKEKKVLKTLHPNIDIIDIIIDIIIDLMEDIFD